MRLLIQRMEWLLERLAGALCLVLLLCLFVEVLTRYVFFISMPEIQFMVPFCFLWMIMLASAVAVRRGQHFEVDLLDKLFHGRARQVHRALMQAMIVLGSVIIVWSSFSFLGLGLMKKNPATGIPMIWIYASITGGGILMAFMALDRLFGGTGQPPESLDEIVEANRIDDVEMPE